MAVVFHDALADSLIGGMPEWRLEFHLDNWRRWMRSDVVGEKAPNRSCGFLPGGNSNTFDEMVDREDVRCARAVDALVSGLSTPERAALNHVYLGAILPDVFRFPRNNLPKLLQSGRFRIAKGLVARGFY